MVYEFPQPRLVQQLEQNVQHDWIKLNLSEVVLETAEADMGGHRIGAYLLAGLLIMGVFASIEPLFAQQRARPVSSPFSLNASGTAMKVNQTSTTQSASLTLSGDVISRPGTSAVKKLNIKSGTLTIGSLSYEVVQCRGVLQQRGNGLQIACRVQSGGVPAKLILFGTVDGSTVNFLPRQSKLVRQYFLSLSGNVS